MTNEVLYEIAINHDDLWNSWTKTEGGKKRHLDLYSLNPTLK